MPTEIKVPALGESVTEATVAKWLKQPGDAVAIDDPVVELETDKATLEIPAPAAGTLAAILAPEGADVPVGAVLGTISDAAASPLRNPPPLAGEGASRMAGQGEGRVPAAAVSTAAATAPSAPPAPAESASPASPRAAVPSPASGGGLGRGSQPNESAAAAALERAGPAVRKLLEESGLDPARLAGTGPQGRITKADVLAARSTAAPVEPPPGPPAARPAPAAGEREYRVRMTRLRRRIAERLKAAQNTAAMLTTFNEIDMSAAIALRERWREAFEKKHGVRLGFMSVFVKAAIVALKELPGLNAEIDGDDIVYKNHYDIGVAVGTEQGLVVPVVRDADRMSFADIEKTIAELGRRARNGRLSIDDLSGGTFTISNGGIYGSLLSTPILNPPQSGILGMHKIERRPVAVGDRVEIRPMMYVALSYDHRIVDGREAVTFLVRVKECVEDPTRMLLDM